MTAATNLGYDEDEWKAHGSAPDRREGPPDNLVLVVENYLEGEPYTSLFFFTQTICIVIMIAVSILEIRHIFLWWHQTKSKSKIETWTCDRSSEIILRTRYNLRGSTPSYNLCQAEYDQLNSDAKKYFEAIPVNFSVYDNYGKCCLTLACCGMRGLSKAELAAAWSYLNPKRVVSSCEGHLVTWFFGDCGRVAIRCHSGLDNGS
jgi:hypothetical protein